MQTKKRRITRASAKLRGRLLQKDTVEIIKDHTGLTDYDIRSRAASVNGMDIELTSENGLFKWPFSVECKNQQSIQIWSAYKQACDNANGLTPLVVFKRNLSEIMCCLTFSDFLKSLQPKVK